MKPCPRPVRMSLSTSGTKMFRLLSFLVILNALLMNASARFGMIALIDEVADFRQRSLAHFDCQQTASFRDLQFELKAIENRGG